LEKISKFFYSLLTGSLGNAASYLELYRFGVFVIGLVERKSLTIFLGCGLSLPEPQEVEVSSPVNKLGVNAQRKEEGQPFSGK